MLSAFFQRQPKPFSGVEHARQRRQWVVGLNRLVAFHGASEH